MPLEFLSDPQYELIESIVYLLMVATVCGTLIYLVETGKSAVRGTQAALSTATAPIRGLTGMFTGGSRTAAT